MKTYLNIILFLFILFNCSGETRPSLPSHDTLCLAPASSVKLTASSTIREIMRVLSEVDYTLNKDSRENWKASVIPRAKEMIRASLALAPGDTELVVFGYGKGYDIPDEIFSDPRFTKIHLVDQAESVVRTALEEKGIQNDKIQIHQEDISLFTDEFYQTLDEIIDSAYGTDWYDEIEQALITLLRSHQYNGKYVPVFKNHLPFLDRNAFGLVISSMTMTQIIQHLGRAVAAKLILKKMEMQKDSPAKSPSPLWLTLEANQTDLPEKLNKPFSQLELGIEEHHMTMIANLLHPTGIVYLGCDIASINESLLAENRVQSSTGSSFSPLTPEIFASALESFLMYSFGLSDTPPPSYAPRILQDSIQSLLQGKKEVAIHPISIRAPVATSLRRAGLLPVHISSMSWPKAPNISTLTEAIIATSPPNAERTYIGLLSNPSFTAKERSA
ncbi:MAG: hypothetical protein JW774_04320 [Candidatus Aureabacteria bacterium]|nr:hypothetical protein [Candidatus Auribacterota bacterium]